MFIRNTHIIRSKHLGDKFDKAAVLATLQTNAERKPKAQFKQDTIGKLIDIQSRMTEGKGIGYECWAKKFNLKAMSQTLILLQEKDLLNEDDLNQRIAELETKYHDSLAVVKDLEGRMKANKELRYHVAVYTSTKNIAQQLKTAKRPVVFEEQHRAELTAHRAAAAYFKANDITKLPSPKKSETEYAQLASEKAKFYEQYPRLQLKGNCCVKQKRQWAVCLPVDIPTGWEPRTNKSPTGAFVAPPAVGPCCSSPLIRCCS